MLTVGRKRADTVHMDKYYFEIPEEVFENLREYLIYWSYRNFVKFTKRC